MAPAGRIGRQSGASWDSAGCFRFLFAIGGPGAGSSRARAAEVYGDARLEVTSIHCGDRANC